MNFDINTAPPGSDEIAWERAIILSEIKRIRQKDTIISFIIILAGSAVACLAVYWSTDSIKYAALTATVFPVLAVVMNYFGITSGAGFRSAAQRLIELNHDLVALAPIAEDNNDITNLSNKYKEVGSYREKARELGRELVNGELAMFWEWDTGTLAQHDKVRDYLEKAKQSVTD